MAISRRSFSFHGPWSEKQHRRCRLNRYGEQGEVEGGASDTLINDSLKVFICHQTTGSVASQPIPLPKVLSNWWLCSGNCGLPLRPRSFISLESLRVSWLVFLDPTNIMARSSHCTCWCGANLAFSSGKHTKIHGVGALFLGLLILSFSFHIPVSLGSFQHLYMTHVLPCGQCPEATCALCQRCFTSSRGSCIIPRSLILLGAQHHSVDVKTAVVFEQFVEVRTWSGVWRGCMRIFCSTQTSATPRCVLAAAMPS